MKKLSVNIFYNLINQIFNFIIPLVLSPYVARVLSAEIIGEYSYALANSTYFVMAESLGLGLYGALRVAAKRDDKEFISSAYKEIMLLKLILMGLSGTVYTIVFIIIPEQKSLMSMIMLANIISYGIDTTWFFDGLEEFKLISLRNISVKTINVILILSLVKSEKDQYTYAIIMQASSLICYVVVGIESWKRIIPSKADYRHIYRHLFSSMVYFVPGIINTIFSAADKTILGSGYNSKYEVGVYEQASKITTLCASVINSVSTVILPRVTYMYHNSSSTNDANKLMLRTIRGAMLITFPIVFGVAAVSDSFVPMFFGEGYEKSAVLLKILCGNVLFSVLANFLGQQGLIARGKQYKYNVAIGIPAVVNVLLNLLLVSRYQSVGVSIASVISSALIVVLVMAFCHNLISYRILFNQIWIYFFSAIVMFLAIIWIKISSNFFTVLIQVVVGFAVYGVIVVLLKDEIANQGLNKLQIYISERKNAKRHS